MLLIGVYGVKEVELYEMFSLWTSTGDFIWVRHPRQIAAAAAAIPCSNRAFIIIIL